MKVLIACEYSGTVRDAFINAGHDAISCDLLPTDKPGPHYEGSVLDILYQDWDMIIAHPPCTFLCNSGVRWFFTDNKEYNTERLINMSYAIKFFYLFYNHPFCKRIAIENPVPHKHAKLPAHSQTIQPYEFGHTTSKRTCLWLKGLPLLKPTSSILKENRTYEIHQATPGPGRWKVRSKTFNGIADAMAKQWGSGIYSPVELF